MKKGLFKKAFTGALAAVVGFSFMPAAESMIAKADDQCDQGTQDGLDWELWNQNRQGTAKMELTGNGGFIAEWSGIENYLARTGKKWASNSPTWESVGDIKMYYDADYRPNGNSYLAVYGWTRKDLVEYYIIENFGTWRPPGGQGQVGTITVNGHIYDVYKAMRYNQPSIDGNTTFPQYFSVRRDNDKSSKGVIDISEHFKQWEKLGLDMGSELYEVSLVVEGYQSSGYAEVKTNYITMDGKAINTGAKPDWIDDPIIEPEPPEPIEPDANGHYINETFESGEGDFVGRGAATVKSSSAESNSGSKSLAVSGRTDSWNGAAINLDENTFKAGESYGFSVMAMQNETSSEDFKLTLQYTDSTGTEQYADVATATGSKGEWVQLANPSYTIPDGASSMILYVETVDSTTDFYIDDAILAQENKISSTPSSKAMRGDMNSDNEIDIYDLPLMRKAVLNSFSGSATSAAADIDGDGNVAINDAVLLTQYILGKISKFPAVTTTTTATTTKPKTTTTTTTKPSSSSGNGSSYMEKIKNTITNNVPSNITANSNNGCKEEKITYYSSVAKKNKKAVVILPPNYSTSKKYPVVYVNHGIFGTENDMVGYCKSIGGNLMASGEAEEMILVSCAMYTSQNSDQCGGFTAEECAKYDAFREDLIECLMPYMEEHYSIKTGRENTGICGFSMGGRESLYIGITRPEYFGYIGAACPAPGITPAQDSFMVHPGNMQPSEFKIQNHAYDPYILMITGGTNDTVVGTFPKQYHEMLTNNNQPHIWQEIQGGGHDSVCVNPLMYNFLKNAFKA
ncbi:MAG: glycoside hydrolase family 11 protein [Ruminococcus sp.]|nr:glycoside hydrolase family 11 protein [Ruminococcus sp.]